MKTRAMARSSRGLLLLIVAACGAAPAAATTTAPPLTMHHVDTCVECGRAPKGQPGSWCPLPPTCQARFEWDAGHVQGEPLSAPGACGAIQCNNTYCLGAGGFDLWIASSPAQPPCPAPPPPPPPAPAPLWHLPARCEEGDVNGLLQWGGVWHLFQQWAARPATSVGHATSPDLLRWTRRPDALPGGAGQCFDGSASVAVVAGALTPLLMIDGDCGHKGPGSEPCMESAGNGSTGGVTAVPADLSDPALAAWVVSGPTMFTNCSGAAGPSPVIVNAATGAAQLVAILGGGEALFEATSPALTAWRLANASFLPQRGGGGGLWHALPPSVDGAPGVRWPTHIFQANGALGDGGATFSLMAVDAARSAVTRITPPAALDASGAVRYCTLSAAGGTGAGGGAGDARTLHVCWFAGAPPDPSCEPGDIDVGQLTALREVRFDPRLGPDGGLVELPIAEYFALRRGLVARNASAPLPPAPAPLLLLPPGAVALDVEVNVSFPAGGGATTVGVACAASGGGCRLTLALSVAAGGGAASLAVQPGGAVIDFPLFAATDGPAVPLRIMIDVASVEVFGAFGRAVFSSGLAYASACGGGAAAAPCTVAASAAAEGASASGAAWALASIFEE